MDNKQSSLSDKQSSSFTDIKGKQNLTPELKQIYEKIMNTPVKSLPSAPPSPQTSVPPPPPSKQPQAVLQQTPPIPNQEAKVIPTVSDASKVVSLPNVFDKNTGNKPFVFSGSKAQSQAVQNPPPSAIVVPRSSSHKKLFLFLTIIFFVGYLFFWLVFFRFI